MKIRPAAIFSFCSLVFFCVFVYQAQDWRMQARLYPLAIGIPMIVLALIQVILDMKGYVAKQSDDATPMDIQRTTTIAPDVAFRRTIIMFSWFFGFFAGIWLVGFSITIPVMVFSYMYFQGKERFTLAASLTVIAYFFFWALFIKLLNLPFPDGQVQTWLGLT